MDHSRKLFGVVAVLVIVIIGLLGYLVLRDSAPSNVAAESSSVPSGEQTAPMSDEDLSSAVPPGAPDPHNDTTEPGDDLAEEVGESDEQSGEEPILCTKDVQQCPDGTYVGRVAPSCAFAECPAATPDEEETQCVQVAKQCPDGTYVLPAGPNCEYDCPTTPQLELAPQPVACTMDVKLCPDGTYVGRVAPDCAFAPCPVPQLQLLLE